MPANFNLQPMQPLRLLLIYVTVVFVGAALIAPWIFHLAQWLAGEFPALEKIARQPFHRYVNRCLIFLSLAGLWPFLRSLGIRSWRDLGFSPVQLHWKNSAAGFLIGFCSLALLAVLTIAFNARVIDRDHAIGMLMASLFGAILSAIAVAILEESLFRGALFGALRKSNPWPAALVVSSAVYALLHFFGKPESPASISWFSGFATLPGMFGGFADFQKLLPGFINLLIVGAILAFAFHRTGNLYFSIGLHAGWVFWLKFYGLMTKKVAGMNFSIWGSSRMVDGWLATAILLAVFGLLLATSKKPERNLYAA